MLKQSAVGHRAITSATVGTVDAVVGRIHKLGILSEAWYGANNVRHFRGLQHFSFVFRDSSLQIVMVLRR